MNGLSWLIYLADVAGSIKAVSVFVILGAVIVAVGRCVAEVNGFGKTNNHRADVDVWDAVMADHVKYPSLYKKPASDRPVEIEGRSLWSLTKPSFIAMLVGLVLVSFVPASATIYAIAASEVGEEVLNSETGGKAVQALNSWLDKQIAK